MPNFGTFDFGSSYIRADMGGFVFPFTAEVSSSGGGGSSPVSASRRPNTVLREFPTGSRREFPKP